MAGEHNMSEPHLTPPKTLVSKVIELALSAGGGAVTLLSGLLAAALILYSSYVLYDTYAIERAASSNAWELLEMRPDILDDPKALFDSAQLEEINKDYVCWLTVFNTPIDYPVVQGPNDTFYAAVDIYGQPSLTGAIYLATGNSRDLSDSYNMIFGHHMDSGAMFGGLDDMTGNETGVMVTRDAIYDVQFFAVVNTDAYEDRIYAVGNRKDNVLDFLRSGGEGGVGIGTDVLYLNEEAAEDAEKLVALSTCANANTSGRLVVIGKMTKRIIMKDITVTKVWDDNENQDGIRPGSVTLIARNGTRAELTAESDWTATVSVPKFDNLGEVQYTWDEVSVTGYSMLSNVTEGDSTTITNKHEPAVKSLTVRKVWDDDENRDGIRPASVTAILSDGQTVTLDSSNNWTAIIDDLPVYANGEEIVYSWSEETPTGYSLSTETQGDTTTLTNTHAPELADITVIKAWNDNNDQDGIRPTELTVSLYGNKAFIGSVTLDENGEWRGSITGQYVYEDGKEIEYAWEEDQVTGYTLTSYVDGMVTTLTNTHIPATKDLTVTKVWDDNHDQDGIRPRSLHLLLNSDQPVTLTKDEDWTATVTGLPVYADGVEIVYTWTEENVTGYSLNSTVVNGNTTILTNRHETGTTVATVTKDWEDDDNRDGIRPKTLTATLSNGQTVTLSEENHWTQTIEGLPANAGGVPIVYTWTEEDVDGYTSGSLVAGTSTEFINTHAIATISQSIKKVWEDNDDQDGIRPTEIVMHLNSNETPIHSVTLKADEDWSAVIDGLPVYENGQPITYSWSEQAITGYTPRYKTEGTDTKITNTHVPEVKDLTVTIVWDDADDQDGIRPATVTVTLSNGQTVELTEDNGWTETLHDLPVYSAGTPIEYSWTEETIDDYTLTDTTVDGNQTTLTNTHIPATVELSVKKIWDDDKDRDRMRPSTLSVRLLAGESAIHIVTLNNVNEWSASLANLPVNAGGQPIAYSWEEDSVNGYELSSKEEESLTILTNKHIPASQVLTVKKVWDDDDNRDGLRPDTLKVTLYADQLVYDTVLLEEANEWTAVLTVPVYDRGIEIHYEWKEPIISGYGETVSIEGNITTFTNKHDPATTVREIKKVWDDADDQDGVRPESLTVYLEADGQVIQTITLDGKHGWTYTADNLFVFSSGKPVRYSWIEEVLPDYPDQNVVSSGTLTTITNKHVPASETLTVTKVWDDNNNQDGIRPESLEVLLLANGEKVGTVTLDPDKGWSGSIDDLPVNANGKPIVYVWDEGEVEGYTISTVTNGTATILTNTHITEKTVATVTKVWDDDSDRDGARPEKLTMTLSTGDTVELSENNNWTATIEGLDRFSAGNEVEYTWTEESIIGYTLVSNVTEGTVTTITNHHDIAKTSKTVVKIWEDNNDRTGERPDSLIVWLNDIQRVVLNAGDNWSATVNDLPVYRNGGRTIIYRWTEEDIPGYTQTSKVTNENTTEITNMLDALETEYTLTIIYWYSDGSEAAPTYRRKLVAGDKYAVWSPYIDDYVASLIRVTGTMPARDLTVIVTYMPAGSGVPLGLGPIGINVGDCME